MKRPPLIPSFGQRDRMKRDELSSKNHKGMKSKREARWRSSLLEAAFVTICLREKISSHMKCNFIISKNTIPQFQSTHCFCPQNCYLPLYAGPAAGEMRWGKQAAGWQFSWSCFCPQVLTGNQKYSKVPSTETQAWIWSS